MSQNDFDNYASEYNNLLQEQLSFFDANNDYFAEYKIIQIKKYFTHPPEKILDFGCGIGRSIPFLHKHFPSSSIVGCDNSEKSLEIAKNLNPFASFFDVEELITQEKRFDLIFLAGVFHHIIPNDRLSVMLTLKKLLSTKGKIVVFEHNPYNPITRYLVNTCPFDHDAVLLKLKELRLLFKEAGIKRLLGYYTLFFPHVFKWLRPIEKYIKYIPMGGQYVVIAQV